MAQLGSVEVQHCRALTIGFHPLRVKLLKGLDDVQIRMAHKDQEVPLDRLVAGGARIGDGPSLVLNPYDPPPALFKVPSLLSEIPIEQGVCQAVRY